MEELDDTLNNILENLKQNFSLIVKDRNMNLSLANSLRYETNIGNGSYIITISLVEYAKYLEQGTYDYKYNENDLLKWIQISKSLPIPLKLPKGQKRLPGEKKGIQPRHIIADSFDLTQLIDKLILTISTYLKAELIKNIEDK